MDAIDKKIKSDITPERRRELEKYARYQGLKFTKQEERKWNDAWKDAFKNWPVIDKPTAEQLRECKEIHDEEWRIECRLESYKPKTPLEFIYVDRIKLNLQEEKTQTEADRADITPVILSELKQELLSADISSTPAMLTIRQGALFCQCTEKTIRNRLRKVNSDNTPMIAGVIGKGRYTRIPRKSLEPFRNTAKVTHNKRRTLQKRIVQKPVKNKA